MPTQLSVTLGEKVSRLPAPPLAQLRLTQLVSLIPAPSLAGQSRKENNSSDHKCEGEFMLQKNEENDKQKFFPAWPRRLTISSCDKVKFLFQRSQKR